MMESTINKTGLLNPSISIREIKFRRQYWNAKAMNEFSISDIDWNYSVNVMIHLIIECLAKGKISPNEFTRYSE